MPRLALVVLRGPLPAGDLLGDPLPQEPCPGLGLLRPAVGALVHRGGVRLDVAAEPGGLLLGGGDDQLGLLARRGQHPAAGLAETHGLVVGFLDLQAQPLGEPGHDVLHLPATAAQVAGRGGVGAGADPFGLQLRGTQQLGHRGARPRRLLGRVAQRLLDPHGCLPGHLLGVVAGPARGSLGALAELVASRAACLEYGVRLRLGVPAQRRDLLLGLRGVPLERPPAPRRAAGGPTRPPRGGCSCARASASASVASACARASSSSRAASASSLLEPRRGEGPLLLGGRLGLGEDLLSVVLRGLHEQGGLLGGVRDELLRLLLRRRDLAARPGELGGRPLAFGRGSVVQRPGVGVQALALGPGLVELSLRRRPQLLGDLLGAPQHLLDRADGGALLSSHADPRLPRPAASLVGCAPTTWWSAPGRRGAASRLWQASRSNSSSLGGFGSGVKGRARGTQSSGTTHPTSDVGHETNPIPRHRPTPAAVTARTPNRRARSV